MMWRIMPKIVDPLFGSMVVEEDQNSYHGETYFDPLKTDVRIRVFPKTGGPTEKHRSFYKEIEQNYFDCIDAMQILIEEEFQKQTKTLRIINFSKEFELFCVNIRQVEDDKTNWSLEYATPHISDGLIEVEFINWEPAKISFVD